MVEYILAIFKSKLMVVYSWGFHNPLALKKGLQFQVNGFKHKGFVKVLYNEGSDLFDVSLESFKHSIVKGINGVYVDELIEVIDRNVELVENYDKKVKDEYSLL